MTQTAKTTDQPTAPTPEQRAETARLNDLLRAGMDATARIGFTNTVLHNLRGNDETEEQAQKNILMGQIELLKAIATAPIDPDDDPYGERDFSALDFRGQRIFWKIDYYANDGTMQWGSDAPWDPTRTIRVMTVMLASDY